jgi:hypothetical protein
MRLATTLAALLFIVAPAIAQQTIENNRHGYTIEIPEEWHEIPSKFLTEFSRSVSKPDQPINYVQAFQKEPFDGTLVYPYILIQSIPYRDLGLDRPPTSEEMGTIVQSIFGVDISDVVDEALDPDLSALVENESSIQRLSFDSGTAEFSYDLNLAVADSGTIRGRARGVFGQRALLQPTYFEQESAWSELRANTTLTSLQFMAEYTYPTELLDIDEITTFTIETVQTPISWVIAAGGIILAITAALALAIIMKIIDRRG